MRAPALRATPVLLVPLLLMLLAAPVGAFEINGGCALDLASTDATGAPVDVATGPGVAGGGTQDDPFLIDWDGTVNWQGTSGEQVFNNHSWQTYVFLVPTPVRGGDPNDEDDVVGSGSAGVSANAPFRISGLYFVSGHIDGEGGTHCDGSAWFKLIGDPVSTVPFWLAILLAVAGAVLIATSRPHLVAGAPAGSV